MPVAPRKRRVGRNHDRAQACSHQVVAPRKRRVSRMNVSYVSASDLMPRMEYTKEWSEIWY